jgi:hypothetical protein
LAGPTFAAATVVTGIDSMGTGGAAQTLAEPAPADSGTTTETPEPSAGIMIFSGLALIGLGRVRRGPR